MRRVAQVSNQIATGEWEKRVENHMVCTWRVQLISWRNWILRVLHNQHHRTWPRSFFYTLVHPLPSIHPASFRKLLCQELRGQEFQRDSLLSACKEVNQGPRGGMESQVRRVLMFSLPEWLSKNKMGGPLLVRRTSMQYASDMTWIWLKIWAWKRRNRRLIIVALCSI